MRLIYLTSKRFPAGTADHHYVLSLAEAFARQLGGQFALIARETHASALPAVPLMNVRAPGRFRSIYYMAWLLRLSFSLRADDVLFSNDLNLLAIAIVCRTFLRKRFSVASDWHLLTETWKDAFVAKRSDILFTTSCRLKDNILRATHVPEERIHVVYGGVNLAPYAAPLPARTELGLPNSAFLIGYVGGFRTLRKEKGIRTMVDALAYLPSHTSMVFVGGSSDEIAIYSAYAAKSGHNARCIWLPQQSNERVAYYERSVNLLAIPYPNEPHFREYGFPMKIWEYIASGKPIVYSNLDIIKEVLGAYDRTFAFKPGSAKDLAQAISDAESKSSLDSSLAVEQASIYSWDAKASAIIKTLASSLRL
jgi:glycosyltransferase involved in cell wall biosynthesis